MFGFSQIQTTLILVAFIIGLGVVGGVNLYNAGYKSGSRNVIEALQKNKESNIKLKGKTDAQIDALSDYDLCIILGGLPDDCRQ